MSEPTGFLDKKISDFAIVKLCGRFPGMTTALGTTTLMAAFMVAINPPTAENIAAYKNGSEAANAYDAALPKAGETVEVVKDRMDKLVETYGSAALPKAKNVHDDTLLNVDCRSHLMLSLDREKVTGNTMSAQINPEKYFNCLQSNRPKEFIGRNPANVKGALEAALFFGIVGGFGVGISRWQDRLAKSQNPKPN